MHKQLISSDLIDIREVNVDRALTQYERIIEYVRQIKDPYHYKCNGYSVTAKFADDGPSFEDCLQRIMA